MQYNLTPEQFIVFLKQRCREKIVGEPAFWEREHGRDEAYRDIIGFIDLYLNQRKDAA